MNRGRKPYKLTEIGNSDLSALVTLYALKGTQLAYKCTTFDMQAIIVIGQNYSVTAISISRLTGYAKGRIYQRLNKTIERGFIAQTGKNPNKYRLTDKGSFAYYNFTSNLKDRLDSITKMASDQETERRLREG